MIQIKCIVYLISFALLASCQSGKSETNYSLSIKPKLSTYRRYPQQILVAKDENIRIEGDRYALGYLPTFDSIILTPVNIPLSGMNGKFYLLPVQLGEQYNITLPGKARAFINAGTAFYTNLSPTHSYYIVNGKAWIKTGNDSATIRAGDFTIQLAPSSSVNIDNYLNDENLLISVLAGYAKIGRFSDSMSMSRGWEICMERKTGKIRTRPTTPDIIDWTVGSLRHFNVDIIYQLNEVGRLYNKDVYVGDLSGLPEIFPLNFDYQNTTVEQAIDLYSNLRKSIKVELSGDSLKVSKRKP